MSLLGLAAAPQRVTAQAQPDAPDPVQALSEQSYEDSLLDDPAAAPLTAAAAPQAAGPRSAAAAAILAGFRCLPSCNASDGRFMAVAGANLVTLSGREMNLQIAVPAGSPSFQLGIFDGDVRATDGAGVAHWDIGVASLYEYTLYADPLGNGTGTTVVEMQPGFPSMPSTAMPDNAWIDFTVATTPVALSPSGNYFYRLSINLTTPSLTTLNAFKIRATAVVSGLTLDPEEEPFSYIASFTSAGDARTIYPNYPASPVPANYDGNFDFYFDLPVSRREVAVWDGDFDRGKFDGTERDTDDPDTPGLLFVPPWATIDTLPEGVAIGVLPSTGNPPDDRNPLPTNPGQFILKSPSVRYDLSFPTGQTFANENPSGNQEWEQFKFSTDTSDPLVDHYTASIPAGTYHLRVQGVDMQNLNALLLPGRLLCLEEDGSACAPLRPFLVGGTAFSDCSDQDGVQDEESGEEPGLAGITIELVDELGNLVATTVTAADGSYSFPVEAETYTVRVAASNFEAGGTLESFISTTPDSRTETVVDENILSFDFGYCGSGTIGDRVWLDTNGDGSQDPGETGIPDVLLELVDENGDVVDQTVTNGDGLYKFPNVPGGTYTVRIDVSSLPAGLVASADRDGLATPDEAEVELAPGDELTDVDFGYTPGASIGDRVWLDSDGDGAQDADEAGIPGVTVRLLDGDGNTVATTTTGANGIYTFADLPAGTYTVSVDPTTLPSGAVATYDLDGIGTLHSATVQVAAGDGRTDVDFGYRGSASLGDRLWLDTDGDGVQDAGETGINGATVQLVDGSGNLMATTTTAGDGNYTFTNLLAGTYSVRVLPATLPAGATPTYDLDGTGTPNVATVSVAGGASRTDVDFGYRGNSSLGDRVWYDVDGDGVQDSGETGINGVTVELRNGSGTLLASTTTAGNGNYSFGNLSSGTYSVRVVAASLPAGAIQTYDLDGTGTANAATVTLATGAMRADVDFGYKGNGSIGDRLWYDADADGVQDAGEPGLGGATVELLNSGGAVIATRTTDANGVYSFGNLLAGSYTVRVVASTLPVGGLAPTFDRDGTGTAHTATVTLTSGQVRTDVDFGYRGTRTVGDRVWKDVDGDGVQDAGETGINGVTVRLFLGSTEVASTVTAGDGNYSFTTLPETTFTVRIDTATLPAGMTQTYDLDGLATPHQATFNLTSNRSDVDFGYRSPSVSCTAGYFKDHFNNASFSNNDGTLSWSGAWIESDSAGAGVSSGNVTVGNPYSGYLFLRDYPDTGTQPSAARQANLAGFSSATLSFSFHVRTAVDPDDAVVVEISKNGGTSYTVLQTLSGFTGTYTGSRSFDISAYLASNTRIRFRVSSNYGASDELFKLDWVRIDGTCGSTPPPGSGSIGDRVWFDRDGDRVQDSGEAGINGVTVQLLNSSGSVVATATTSGNGNYTFGNLTAGSYSVKVVSSTLPAGAVQTHDLDGTGTAHQAAVTLTAGQSRTDVDFGYKGSLTIGDRVWNDRDSDRAQDSTEPGIGGATVKLYDASNNLIASTTTNSSGNYSFSNLLPGTYTVKVVSSTLPSGVTQTFDRDGTSTPHAATVSVTASRSDIDFGYRGSSPGGGC